MNTAPKTTSTPPATYNAIGSRRLIVTGFAMSMLLASSGIAFAAAQPGKSLSLTSIESLQAEGKRKGWTFQVADNPAREYDLSELTGLVIPENWRDGAPFDDGAPRFGAIPASYDWRSLGGTNYCTPIRNQSGCGSCWAFALMGSMESCIRIEDGISTDLSEQWLVSCCGLGGCSGEWPGNAANYLLDSGSYVDSCGDHGAVLEADFPYAAADLACGCPYDHPFTINDWAFIGPEWGTPSTNQLKQAILDHGPITVCVRVNSSFQAYSGDIFNDDADEPVNHAVVLVGWDDNQGTNGIWHMRNSWGSSWGEGGYMRIEYGCSRIGYNGLYLNYGGTDSGACCLSSGACAAVYEYQCEDAGGEFLGSGSSCDAGSCAAPCPADLDASGGVDVNDLLMVIAAWGTANSYADFNEDGDVNVNDLLELIAAWGPCP